MKIEEGMYVRTNAGNISKIKYIKNECITLKETKSGDFYLENGEIYHLYYGDKPKASFSIIDLIEVGDYVNGHRVNYVNRDIKHFNIAFGDEYYGLKSRFNDDLKWVSLDEIKSVVTHERFKDMEYRIDA